MSNQNVIEEIQPVSRDEEIQPVSRDQVVEDFSLRQDPISIGELIHKPICEFDSNVQNEITTLAIEFEKKRKQKGMFVPPLPDDAYDENVEQRYILIDDIHIDFAIQRDRLQKSSSRTRLYDMGADWDYKLCGPILAARVKGDDKIYAYDGFGRAISRRLTGERLIPAMIFVVDSHEEIAALFNALQEKTQKLTAFEKFKNSIMTGDKPLDLVLHRMMKGSMISPDPENNDPDKTKGTCLTMFIKILQKYSGDDPEIISKKQFHKMDAPYLTRAWDVQTTVWPDEDINGHITKGIAGFLHIWHTRDGKGGFIDGSNKPLIAFFKMVRDSKIILRKKELSLSHGKDDERDVVVLETQADWHKAFGWKDNKSDDHRPTLTISKVWQKAAKKHGSILTPLDDKHIYWCEREKKLIPFV